MPAPEPGYGVRHLAIASLMREATPAATTRTAPGAFKLRISAHLSDRRLPEQLITSVRCLVRIDNAIVVTQSPDDVNIWPGGRREPNETIRGTAIREVHEETGVQLDPSSLRLLGFLHFEHLVPPPPDYQYPHPDFLQLVFTAKGLNPPSDDWHDIDGYVQHAWLETPARARSLPLDPVALPFLEAFERTIPT